MIGHLSHKHRQKACKTYGTGGFTPVAFDPIEKDRSIAAKGKDGFSIAPSFAHVPAPRKTQFRPGPGRECGLSVCASTCFGVGVGTLHQACVCIPKRVRKSDRPRGQRPTLTGSLRWMDPDCTGRLLVHSRNKRMQEVVCHVPIAPIARRRPTRKTPRPRLVGSRPPVVLARGHPNR